MQRMPTSGDIDFPWQRRGVELPHTTEKFLCLKEAEE
jgi:hypothetical protein